MRGVRRLTKEKYLAVLDVLDLELRVAIAHPAVEVERAVRPHLEVLPVEVADSDDTRDVRMSAATETRTTTPVRLSGIGLRFVVFVVALCVQRTEVKAIATIIGQDLEHVPVMAVPSDAACA